MDLLMRQMSEEPRASDLTCLVCLSFIRLCQSVRSKKITSIDAIIFTLNVL